jgi:broad specificity phosphatase PhoE
VRSACEELFAVEGEGARASGAVVVVSHVSPIKAATCWALGLGDQGAWRLYLATASITRIAWGTDGPVLHRYNETPWSEPG